MSSTRPAEQPGGGAVQGASAALALYRQLALFIAENFRHMLGRIARLQALTMTDTPLSIMAISSGGSSAGSGGAWRRSCGQYKNVELAWPPEDARCMGSRFCKDPWHA